MTELLNRHYRAERAFLGYLRAMMLNRRNVGAVFMQTFKQFEHDSWELVADNYHGYWESLTSQTIDSLLDSVRAGEGVKLIDVACGPGYVADAARRRGSTVVGVDFSARMIEKARHSFPSIEFLEGDAERLNFPNQSFDAFTMNFGILHLEQPEQALSEAYRVLGKKGRAAFTIWSTPDAALGFQCVLSCVQEHGDMKVDLPPGPPFFRFSQEDEFLSCLKAANFDRVEFKRLPMSWTVPSSQEFFQAFLLGTPRTGGLLKAQTKERLEKIEQAIMQSAQQFQKGDKLVVPMQSLLAVAYK